MGAVLAGVIRAAADAVFPPRCRACGNFLAPGKRVGPVRGEAAAGALHGFSDLLCKDCRKGFLPVRSPLCTRCGTMFSGGAGEDHLCGECLDAPAVFGRARAAGVYDGPLLALVHAFKFKNQTELAGPLAGLLKEAFHRFWGRSGIDGVVPVPLHPRRLRSRGFNPAALLIRRWIDLDSDKPPWAPLMGGALLRRRPTAAQSGLGRKDRLNNIRGAFVPGKQSVAGMRLLLVDDVYTTGATARECSRVLSEAGAARVDVLTLARAMPDLTRFRRPDPYTGPF
ncbi:MAG: ComF family protein [Desulfobacterales bacterium]|jgi:ComF family protein